MGEVYNDQKRCSAVSRSTADSLKGQNVAAASQGGVPFGSGSLPGYCTTTAAGEGKDFSASGIHCWKNINDGRLGNSYSWIPGHNGAFVGVRFAKPELIEGLRVSRKGTGSCCNDRIGGSYEVQYATVANANHLTAAESWTSLGAFTRHGYGFEYFKFCDLIHATALRIIASDSGACIDELVVYNDQKPPSCSAVTRSTADALKGQNVAAASQGGIPFDLEAWPGIARPQLQARGRTSLLLAYIVGRTSMTAGLATAILGSPATMGPLLVCALPSRNSSRDSASPAKARAAAATTALAAAMKFSTQPWRMLTI